MPLPAAVGINLIDLNPIQALFWSEVLNGVVSVPLMGVMMRWPWPQGDGPFHPVLAIMYYGLALHGRHGCRGGGDVHHLAERDRAEWNVPARESRDQTTRQSIFALHGQGENALTVRTAWAEKGGTRPRHLTPLRSTLDSMQQSSRDADDAVSLAP